MNPRRKRHKLSAVVNPDRGLNPGPTDIIAESDVEVCCATTALPGRYSMFGLAFAPYMNSHKKDDPLESLNLEALGRQASWDYVWKE
jgi:hypothetical protein